MISNSIKINHRWAFLALSSIILVLLVVAVFLFWKFTHLQNALVWCQQFVLAVLPKTISAQAVLFGSSFVLAISMVRVLYFLGKELFYSRKLKLVLKNTIETNFGNKKYFVFDSTLPTAFTKGFFRPKIFVSSGAIQKLSTAELAAVLTHEIYHASRRHPLKGFAAQIFSNFFFFIPLIKDLSNHFLKYREVHADNHAKLAGFNHAIIGSALLKMSVFSPASTNVSFGYFKERVEALALDRNPPLVVHVHYLFFSFLFLVIMFMGQIVLPARASSDDGVASCQVENQTKRPTIQMSPYVKVELISSPVLQSYKLNY